MNLQEAYKELELSEGATEKEINDAFRKMSKKYHPDINKEAIAEEKFKKINQAKQILENPQESQMGGMNPNIANFMNMHMHRGGNGGNIRPRVHHPDPVIIVNLTFLESVNEATKEISYHRHIKCEHCDGSGSFTTNDTCPNCKGSGGSQSVRGNQVFINMCSTCQGGGKKKENCTHCNGGTIHKEEKKTLKMPIVANGDMIGVNGAGNFKGISTDPFFGQKQIVYGDLNIKINVEKDAVMSLSEDKESILSTINISLLEALKGTTKKVKTIKGELTLKIKEDIKNKDEIVANGYGPNGSGQHIFTINVEYPKEKKYLIKLLEKNNKK